MILCMRPRSPGLVHRWSLKAVSVLGVMASVGDTRWTRQCGVSRLLSMVASHRAVLVVGGSYVVKKQRRRTVF